VAGADWQGRTLGSFYSTGYEPSWRTRLTSCGAGLPDDLFVPRELGHHDDGDRAPLDGDWPLLPLSLAHSDA
jgi:hypothetical protein